MLLSKDQMRKIETLHKDLAKQTHDHYTDHCGVVADSDIAFVDQTTFGEIIQSLGDRTVSYTFTLAPLGPVVISYSLPIAYALIEYALGSKPDGDLNEAEREVMDKIFKRDLQNIESMWGSIVSVKGEDAQLETNPNALEDVLARPTTTNLIAFEIHLPHASGLVEFSYPIHETLETIIPKLSN